MTTLLESQAYWDRQPCNIRHSKHEVGTKEFFDDVEARKYFVEPHIPGFAEFSKWKGKRVLEIGCGIGTDAVNFARAGAYYTGIDFSPVSIELVRKRFEVYGLKGEIYLGNAEYLEPPLPPAIYDLVYSFGVIHHCQNPQQVINEIRHYMGPESELRIMLYARRSWKSIMIAAGMAQPEAQEGCPIVHTYTPTEARELLHGFETIEVWQDHIFPYRVEKYVRHEYEREHWFEAMPPIMFRTLELFLGWHLLIRAVKR